MRRISKVDLIGVPWPVNLLKCYQHTGEMRPGDEMVITLKDEDVKDSLLLILNGMPEISFDISIAGSCYAINVMKIETSTSAKDSGVTSKN